MRFLSPTFLITLILTLTCPQGMAAEPSCEGEMRAITTLPRDLKLSPEAAAFLATKPEYASILYSLSRVFSALDENHLAQLGRSLNLRPLENTPLAVLEAFGDSQLEAADYDFLVRSLLKLPRHQAVERRYDLFGDSKGHDDPDVFLQSRLEQMLKFAPYRRVYAQLLELPRVRRLFMNVITALAQKKIKVEAMGEFEANALGDRLLKGPVSKYDASLIGMLARTFALDVANYFNDNNADYEETVSRQDYLVKMEQFLAWQMGVHEGLSSVISLMDYHAFGTPLPLSSERVYQIILDEAKSRLLPLKAEYARERSKKANLKPEAGPVAPFELRLVDHLPPRPQAPLRERKTSATPMIDDAPSTVSPETELWRYTSKERGSADALPLANLRTDLIYSFWYMRDDRALPREVRFSAAALEWFGEHPVPAQKMINALHFGWASDFDESGIKRLGRVSKRYDGDVFELKIEDYRGLMVFEGEIWQLLSVQRKDDALRTAAFVSPL